MALSGITGLAAIAALAVTLLNVNQRIDTIQTARQESAFDTCRVFDAVIGSSAGTTSRVVVYDIRGRVIGYAQFGGAGQRQKVRAFIRSVGLADCHQYAQRVRNGDLRPLKLQHLRRVR